MIFPRYKRKEFTSLSISYRKNRQFFLCQSQGKQMCDFLQYYGDPILNSRTLFIFALFFQQQNALNFTLHLQRNRLSNVETIIETPVASPGTSSNVFVESAATSCVNCAGFEKLVNICSRQTPIDRNITISVTHANTTHCNVTTSQHLPQSSSYNESFNKFTELSC